MQNLIEKLPKIKIVPKVYLGLPETPGIYIYFKNGIPIYVGKAINLKRRVSSYFNLDLEVKTARLMSEAEELSFIQVSSELEALLLEAKLIKSFQPKYNIISKDDKHPLYIRITKETYPRVLTARKIEEKEKNIAFYGPFPSSANVKSVLKMLRRIFSYSDHKLGSRACLYSHIGLCDPCPNEIEKIQDPISKQIQINKYRRNIKHIKSILDGKIDKVRKTLEKEMGEASKNEDYEKAAMFRNKVQSLLYITRPQMPTSFYMQNPNLYEDQRMVEIRELRDIINNVSGWRSNSTFQAEELHRIECYDVAHLAGANPTASMVTFIDGIADKSLYRHFKIKIAKGGDDYASMKEVIERRKKHFKDWGKPDLIIVDGGRGQVSVFRHELERDNIPVVGLAKRFETLVIPVKMLGTTNLSEYRLPKGPALNLVERMRDEAHRFARVYHHKLFSKALIEGK